MSKKPEKKSASYRIYQILMAVIAFVMIVSLIAMAVRF
jgi:ABC-type transport system involved in multi-copper enzyme maturation permease subunit